MSITEKQIIEIINQAEEKLNVNEWIIQGIHYWPIIRISLVMNYSYRDKKEIQEKENYFSQITQIVRKLNSVYKKTINFVDTYFIERKNNSHNPIEKSDVVFLTYTTDRNLVNGLWYDIFCDPIIEELQKVNLQNLVLELVPNAEYRLPRHKDSVFIQFVMYSCCVTARLRFITNIFNEQNENLELIKNLKKLNELFKAADLDLYNFVPSWKQIKITLNLIILKANYFKSVLKKANPKLGFVICYYSNEGMAFNLACRELGITSVDIQHGLQGDAHISYGRWNKSPEKGYELLPSLFWCWGIYEANAIEKWNTKVSNYHKPIVGGHPWINKWLEHPHDLATLYEQQILSIKNTEANSLHILLTLQPLNPYIEPWLLSVINNSPSSWFWWIRLHPAMMSEREKVRSKLIQHCGTANFQIDLPTDLPLPVLLMHAGVHVTKFSSTVIEAELFGVYSIVTDPSAIDFFPCQIDSGIALYVNESNQLLQAIKFQASQRKKLNNKGGSSFASNQTVIRNLLTETNTHIHFS